jgi:uncharacterized protein (DUF2235 family)
MPKNIILCSDGTGNTGVKGRGTNVFKLFEAVDLNEYRTNPELDAQLAFYDDGVGTQGTAFLKMLGGAAGYGLARNVKKLYRELSRVYDPGDKIFLFGFSRGAFTVRTLAGMIHACGVLKGETIATARQLLETVDDAYDAYRARYNSKLTGAVGRLLGWPEGQQAIDAFKNRHKPHVDVPIAFIGVWDTVDAVGMPFALADIVNNWIVQFKFPSQTLGERVDHAYHALSLDDDRLAFKPVLWSVPEGDTRVEQVWFAGVHSNVGGGYPKQGMSLVALDWMLCHAAEHGLRLQALDYDIFRGHASVDDMLYDPRAGVGTFYRWAPRDVEAYCKRSGVKPRIHVSVAERIAHGTDDYAPGNIPPDVMLTMTLLDKRDPEFERKQEILQRRTDALQTAIRKAHEGRKCLLDDVRSEIQIGDVSYWLFLTAWLCAAMAAVAAAGAMLRGNPLWQWWMVGPLLAAGFAFLVAWRLASAVDKHMSDKFSEFWQSHQPKLRAALKQAHADARAANVS